MMSEPLRLLLRNTHTHTHHSSYREHLDIAFHTSIPRHKNTSNPLFMQIYEPYRGLVAFGSEYSGTLYTLKTGAVSLF
jgi:hypothetical protein